MVVNGLMSSQGSHDWSEKKKLFFSFKITGEVKYPAVFKIIISTNAGIVTPTVSSSLVSNVSSKPFVEVVEQLTAAGKEPFHSLDHLLSHNFYENQAVDSQNICREIINVSSDSEYLCSRPANFWSLMQGEIHKVAAAGDGGVVVESVVEFNHQKWRGGGGEVQSWLSTVCPMALNPTWRIRKNSHRNRKP